MSSSFKGVESVNKTTQEFKTFITRGNVVDMAVCCPQCTSEVSAAIA